MSTETSATSTEGSAADEVIPQLQTMPTVAEESDRVPVPDAGRSGIPHPPMPAPPADVDDLLLQPPPMGLSDEDAGIDPFGFFASVGDEVHGLA